MEEQLSLFEYANKDNDGLEPKTFTINEILRIYKEITCDYFSCHTSTVAYEIPASYLITELCKRR